MTCWMHHHLPKIHIGTYCCHFIPFNHIWIGWNITCHTWSLLAEKIMIMINGRQLSKQTTKRSCWDMNIAQGGLCGGNLHIWMDAWTLLTWTESWSVGFVHMDLLVGVSLHSLVGWGDTYFYFLIPFSGIILMHHFIVSSLGILVGWMILTLLVVRHGIYYHSKKLL